MSPTTRGTGGEAISREDGLNLEIEVGRAGGSPLADDYVAGTERARSFYEGWWGDPEAYLAKAAEVRERFDRAARERAARAMYSEGEQARRRLDAWVERGGYVVTTGQQPGLFTGPLYSIYKALTAARLASVLEDLLEAPVLPLFWVASEDHDWEEANHTWVVGVDNELRRIEVARPAGAEGRALHRIRLDAELTPALQAFLAALPETEFSPDYRGFLERAYAPGHTLSEGFRSVLGSLLAPFGVYLVDAGDPAVKEGSRALLERELEDAETNRSLLTERALALEAEGYAPQVPILPASVNLFVEGPAGRERLYSDDGTFHLRHSRRRLTAPELRARMDADPLSVSPNVLLRPLVESAVFPTLSLVVGPGELAYFGQLQPYFLALGIRPPVAYPRFAATAVEGKVRKVLQKFGVDAGDLRRPFHELAADITREEVPDDVRRALDEIRGALASGGPALADAVRAIQPTLAGPVQRALSVSMDAWADAERKILQALKRENETRLSQLQKARLHLYPEGKPQERMINGFYYLFRYGGEFLEGLAERFDAGVGAAAPRA